MMTSGRLWGRCGVLMVALLATAACSAGGGDSGNATGADAVAGADASGTDGTESTDATDATGGADGTDATDATDGTTGTDGVSGTDGATGTDGVTGTDGTTGVDGNDGPPAPGLYSGETCPTLQAGSMSFASNDVPRDITVTVPANPEGAGVLFLWHGFGDSHSNFSAALSAQWISDNYNVITVSSQAALDPFESQKLAPYKDLAEQYIGALPPTWSILDGPEMDLQLFDDLLTCVDEQYGIDRKRVYSMGFSQGGLWTSLLIMLRSEQIAAAIAWSGGLGTEGGFIEVVRFDYETPARRIPILTASGGTADVWPDATFALVNFQTGSEEFSAELRADGHANVACNHGKGHTIPADGLQWGLTFLFDHEWTADGESDYFGYGGEGFPDYCTFPSAN